MHDHDDGIKFFLVGNIKIRAYHEKRNGEIYTHVCFRKFSTIIEQSCIWGCIVQHVSDDIQIIPEEQFTTPPKPSIKRLLHVTSRINSFFLIKTEHWMMSRYGLLLY